MTEKHQSKGILESLFTESDGEESGDKIPPLFYVPGMGLNASQDATRWAWIGYYTEMMRRLGVQDKRPLGQPKKDAQYTNDTKRAFLLYATVERIRSVNEIERGSTFEMPLANLIAAAQKLFPTHGLFDKPAYTNKMYASVKRGREILGIDAYWRGPEIESLFK